ncbi:ornithine cyclodeaminase family protein [Rhodobaculum claviforme]|uniref:Ornithine cyclodeaminase n=1 Tax=Rhodobaculum claviforme TaxID=1549854 RepID=A0A934WJE2_9RHOB|nr:ornithine cyclodeaminase [Rhodobaculum claviforme]MBK5927433.1 ornithine cyclodeaminase [Rhodobaculum claviforme]
MTTPPISVGPEVEGALDWLALTDALIAGHARPRAELADVFLTRGGDTLLSRAAMIDGLGSLVKTATVFPDNPARGLAAVNGAASLFDDATGLLEALVDFHLLTKWKTAGDSLLAARLLARPESRAITLVGAGTVARSMAEAYARVFPGARFTVWSRTEASARTLADAIGGTVAPDLEGAVRQADIVCTATISRVPLVCGDWLQPGQHLDLIGAFRADMREVDDTALRRARIFVDSRETTIAHIGELKDPIARGVIGAHDIVADFHDIASGRFARGGPDEITLAKNGGGAHLDLMTARYLLERAQEG